MNCLMMILLGFLWTFDRHAPLKQKYVRSNQVPFMTKELRKAAMIRSKRPNDFNKKEVYRICIQKAKKSVYLSFQKSKTGLLQHT